VHHDVFVYGTLKYGEGNNDVLHGPRYSAVYEGVKCTANSEWGLWSYGPYGIPFVYHKSEGGSKIQGEHWRIDDIALDWVRALESGYDEIQVVLEDGTQAYMYVYPANALPVGGNKKYYSGSKSIDFPAIDGIISWPLTAEIRHADV
jgi:gamma-glutamylcyclotransferase (GGCT)/AIG2-like uncharacterized protein YtfP